MTVLAGQNAKGERAGNVTLQHERAVRIDVAGEQALHPALRRGLRGGTAEGVRKRRVVVDDRDTGAAACLLALEDDRVAESGDDAARGREILYRHLRRGGDAKRCRQLDELVPAA